MNSKTFEVSEILLECARDYEQMASLMKETFDFRMSISMVKAYEDCIRKAHILHSIAIPSPSERDE
jgi:hypothetical protein